MGTGSDGACYREEPGVEKRARGLVEIAPGATDRALCRAGAITFAATGALALGMAIAAGELQPANAAA